MEKKLIKIKETKKMGVADKELFKNLNYEECCRDRAENKKAMWETSLCSRSSSSTHLSEPEVLSQHL